MISKVFFSLLVVLTQQVLCLCGQNLLPCQSRPFFLRDPPERSASSPLRAPNEQLNITWEHHNSEATIITPFIYHLVKGWNGLLRRHKWSWYLLVEGRIESLWFITLSWHLLVKGKYECSIIEKSNSELPKRNPKVFGFLKSDVPNTTIHFEKYVFM